MVVPVSHLTGRCHPRSAQDGLFDVPRSRTVFGSRASSIAARPQACNQLPADIHNTATYWIFKHSLKSFLCSVAYGLFILSYIILGFITDLLNCLGRPIVF